MQKVRIVAGATSPSGSGSKMMLLLAAPAPTLMFIYEKIILQKGITVSGAPCWSHNIFLYYKCNQFAEPEPGWAGTRE
jgi:hypothetical protein